MTRLLPTAALLCFAALLHAQEKPLPAIAELRARALDNFKKSEQARERYICRERIENDELDGKGQVKKKHVTERELFYVNGYAISQVVGTDGKALNAGEQKKRDEAVAKAIGAATNHQKPKEEGLVINAGDVVRMAKLTGERRILVAGRPTIVFEVASDKDAKADSLEQKLMRAMEGTISIDESTGNIQDINTHSVRDVKVGGGLVANVHKGARVHMLSAPQPDGIWLLTLAEGTGDARIGMFVKEGVQFRQETEGCKLFSVSAEGSVKK